MSKANPQDKTPVMQEPPRPPSKAASVFQDDDDTQMTVLAPRAVAHVTAALQAIETLSGILLKLHEDSDLADDYPPVDPLDTRGILNAIAICSGSVYDHLTGGGVCSHYTMAIEKGESGFDQIAQLTHQARDLQRTKREKRRLEIVEGRS